MKTTLDEQLIFGNECLIKALNMSTDKDFDEHQKNMSVEFMQCIAQIRFGMCFAAKMFFEYYCNPDQRKNLPRATKENLEKLRSNAQNLAEKGVLKEPQEFLIKQIVRQYGFPYLYQLGDLAEFEWFAPKSKVKKEPLCIICNSFFDCTGNGLFCYYWTRVHFFTCQVGLLKVWIWKRSTSK